SGAQSPELYPRTDTDAGAADSRGSRAAAGASGVFFAQTLVDEHSPGSRAAQPSRLLPRRVHLSLQPTYVRVAWQALLPADRAGCRYPTAPVSCSSRPRRRGYTTTGWGRLSKVHTHIPLKCTCIPAFPGLPPDLQVA